LTANGEPWPTRISQPEPKPIRLRAEAASAIPFERLELIANGTPVAAAPATISDIFTAVLEVEHTLPLGGWLAARCWGAAKPDLYPHVPAFAHTSPLWIEVAGQPVPRVPAAVAALARDIDGVRHWIQREGRFTNTRRKAHLLELCDAAAEKLGGSP
jgi:hypothetical protein